MAGHLLLVKPTPKLIIFLLPKLTANAQQRNATMRTKAE